MAGQRQIRRDAEAVNALDHAIRRRDADTVSMVQRAVEHREVMLAFQPVVQANRPDQVAFHEALLRVLDDTGRVIPARDFIHAVEDTELGRKLDRIALQQGIEELAQVPDLRLSINMSARSIGFQPWLRTLNRGLQEDPTIAERLILEITETSAMLVPELVVRFMADLRKKGVAFAIDDFGSGQTALRYFRDFNFDVLKIDGQFVRGIAGNADNQVLVRAMAAIAEQFDMFTVAEKVERAADAECLAALGIDCLQGYYFAAPTLSPPWQKSQARKSA
ncbi:EAL domain-containing protein [Thalassococcus arenae]|uniref:EAL domain-containing protein n=1 Tax=Thalassococcus arenae TaxID=2851652 RepID=UPI0032AF1866